ncbi:glutaminyl-peptide cyclotransferase [Olivibacter sp. SDN3]|uniref:glutaminyl-peptide cyclotransferase n=1 Tax=Olivibacter sp. SDN3 TaxID=2764720 RepID=UPI0016515542|nr:glutaminyl-peptide cyclotransferase [Olivibacter sp. SDN3]QNL50189.1 glutaminyl-peptide cyclotransferase [Olivibacter sp. SDN3]
MLRLFKILGLIITLSPIACNTKRTDTNDLDDTYRITAPNPVTLLYDIVDTIPHDTSAFTEGFEYHNGSLFESTGEYGSTSIRKINPENGKTIERFSNNDQKIFGEGITLFDGKLYQLTYQTNQVFVYNQKDLNRSVAELRWPKEGWGLCNDGEYLLLSDGSSTISYVDPDNFKLIKTLSVNDHSGAVDQLNELEYIDGYIYANRWHHDKIYKIDPASGYVVGMMHLEGLIQQYAPHFEQDTEKVLNGIAWDHTHEIMYLTGKNWPLIFKVKLHR